MTEYTSRRIKCMQSQSTNARQPLSQIKELLAIQRRGVYTLSIYQHAVYTALIEVPAAKLSATSLLPNQLAHRTRRQSESAASTFEEHDHSTHDGSENWAGVTWCGSAEGNFHYLSIIRNILSVILVCGLLFWSFHVVKNCVSVAWGRCHFCSVSYVGKWFCAPNFILFKTFLKLHTSIVLLLYIMKMYSI